MYSYPKVRKPAPPPPILSSAPPSYTETVHDVSIESDDNNHLLGVADHIIKLSFVVNWQLALVSILFIYIEI
jgi:hypothetical protein